MPVFDPDITVPGYWTAGSNYPATIPDPNGLFAGDPFRVLVEVQDDTGARKSLAGATVAGAARKLSGSGGEVTPAAFVADAEAGEVGVSFPSWVLTAGNWRLQVRISIGDEAKVVLDLRFTVRGAIVPYAVPVMGALTYNSLDEARRASVHESVQAIRRLGYYAAGDGGEVLDRRVVSEPPHAGHYQTADGARWEVAERVVPLAVFGAMGSPGADDAEGLRDALVWQAAVAGGLRVERLHEIGSLVEVGSAAELAGILSRETGFIATDPAARLRIGGTANAAGVRISNLLLNGADLADTMLELSDAMIGGSVCYTGNANFETLRIEQCVSAALVIGEASDDGFADRLLIRNCRKAGTSCDGIHWLSPFNIAMLFITGMTGWGIVTGDATGRQTNARVLGTARGRFNSCGKGWIRHDGRTWSRADPRAMTGIDGDLVIEDGFFENGGTYNAGQLEPVVAQEFMPCGFRVDHGSLRIVRPQTVRANWLRSLGRIDSGLLDIEGAPGGITGNVDTGQRELTGFIVGQAPDHSARLILRGPWRLLDPGDWTEFLRCPPRVGAWPVEAPDADLVWLEDGSGIANWQFNTAAPYHATAATTTTAGEWATGGVAIKITADGGPDNNRIARPLHLPPEAEGALVLLSARMKVLSMGALGRAGLAVSLSGSGLSLLGPIFQWSSAQETANPGRWVNLCAMALVSDPSAADNEARVFVGKGEAGEASDGVAALDMARLQVLRK